MHGIHNSDGLKSLLIRPQRILAWFHDTFSSLSDSFCVPSLRVAPTLLFSINIRPFYFHVFFFLLSKQASISLFTEHNVLCTWCLPLSQSHTKLPTMVLHHDNAFTVCNLFLFFLSSCKFVWDWVCKRCFTRFNVIKWYKVPTISFAGHVCVYAWAARHSHVYLCMLVRLCVCLNATTVTILIRMSIYL